MARTRRIHYPGLIYHVINRGNNRQMIFFEDADYQLYLNLLYRYKKKYQFKLFCYCLMANHIHLLIKVGEKGNISQIMQAITNAHTRHYHFKYHTSGHVWQGRFKSPIIGDDQYLLTVMQYIEQNPIRAGMVRQSSDYRWSSYHDNICDEPSRLIDREENPAYAALDPAPRARPKEYQKIFTSDLNENKLADIKRSIEQSGNYMGECFLNQINEWLSPKRKRGRPRKVYLKNNEFSRK